MGGPAYIDPSRATHLRVLRVGAEVFNIDAADQSGNYTAACWNWDTSAGAPIGSLPRAVWLAQCFAAAVAPHLLGTKPRVSLATLQRSSHRERLVHR